MSTEKFMYVIKLKGRPILLDKYIFVYIFIPQYDGYRILLIFKTHRHPPKINH